MIEKNILDGKRINTHAKKNRGNQQFKRNAVSTAAGNGKPESWNKALMKSASMAAGLGKVRGRQPAGAGPAGKDGGERGLGAKPLFGLLARGAAAPGSATFSAPSAVKRVSELPVKIMRT